MFEPIADHRRCLLAIYLRRCNVGEVSGGTDCGTLCIDMPEMFSRDLQTARLVLEF